MDIRTIDLGDVELVIAEAGQGGRPVLLLHGFTGAKEDFTEWLDQMAGEGWHAVAPDHRGHGGSSKPDGEDAYSIDILAADARRLTEALGWSHFALLGHSMGGYVAQSLAFAVPDRLDALVLMDTGHGPIEGVDPAQAELAVQIAREQGMDVLADLMAAREGVLDTPAHLRVAAERPGYVEFGERKFRATSPYLYAAIAPELLRDFPDTLDRLAAMSPVPPTLVIVGEQDAPFLAFSERMAKAVPGATLAIIPDAGHSPQFENPDRWWTELSAFVRECPATGSRMGN
jgi:pimeloyl-ACP methyl ester carboxylesterase